MTSTQNERLLRRGLHSLEVGSVVNLEPLKFSALEVSDSSLLQYEHIENSFRQSFLIRSQTLMASLLQNHGKLEDPNTVLEELRSIHFALRSMYRGSYAFGFEGLGSLQDCLVDVVVGLRTYPAFHGAEVFDLLRNSFQAMQQSLDSISQGNEEYDELVVSQKQKIVLLRDRIVERLYGAQ